jgi:hypothetical protein
MFKALALDDLLKGIIPGLLTTLAGVVVSLTLYVLFPSGEISYFDTKTTQGRLIVLGIENNSNYSTNFVLSIDADIISVSSSSGTAGLSLERQDSRTGTLLAISDLTGASVDNIVLNASDRERRGNLIRILKSPVGYRLVNRDLPSLYIIGVDRIISLSLNALVVFIFIVAGNAYLNIRLRGFKETADRLKKETDILGEQLVANQSRLDIMDVRLAKRKILYARTLREARTEIDFWRTVFRDVLTRSGQVTKQDSNRLLQSLARRLGFDRGTTIQDFDVSEIVELLIDESNNDRMKKLVQQIKIDKSEGD